MRPLDLTGQRFGRLVVTGLADHVGKRQRRAWACLCDCGNESRVETGNLRSTTSCGCSRIGVTGRKPTNKTRACACCGATFTSTRKETRVCSRACINRTRRRPTLEERFRARVEVRGENECWPWRKPHAATGYGRMKWVDGRQHSAHRIAWELANGKPFPDGLHACHSCDNPVCCNPTHIWPGTATENVHDRDNKGRTSQGEKHYAAKLTAEQVREIRASSESHSALARVYGVAISHVALIRKGLKWRSVA